MIFRGKVAMWVVGYSVFSWSKNTSTQGAERAMMMALPVVGCARAGAGQTWVATGCARMARTSAVMVPVTPTGR